MGPVEKMNTHPEGFRSIEFSVDDESFQLNVLGWTPEAIGTSEPVYQKLFSNSIDAYYQVTLDQIQLLTDSDSLKLRTTGSAPKEFVSWYRQTTFQGDLRQFVRTVLR